VEPAVGWSVDCTADRFVLDHLNRSLLILLCILFFTATAGAAPGNEPSADRRRRAEDLTQSLVSLNARNRDAGERERGRLLDEMSSTAQERKNLLTSLMEDDPAGVLG